MLLEKKESWQQLQASSNRKRQLAIAISNCNCQSEIATGRRRPSALERTRGGRRGSTVGRQSPQWQTQSLAAIAICKQRSQSLQENSSNQKRQTRLQLQATIAIASGNCSKRQAAIASSNEQSQNLPPWSNHLGVEGTSNQMHSQCGESLFVFEEIKIMRAKHGLSLVTLRLSGYTGLDSFYEFRKE